MTSLRSDRGAHAPIDLAKAAEGSAKAAQNATLRSNPLNQNASKAAKAAKADPDPCSSIDQYDLIDWLNEHPSGAEIDIAAEPLETPLPPEGGEEVFI
jgi:hypothetical protein